MSAKQRIAERFLVRQAARQACQGRRTASQAGLTPAVVEAFAEAFYLPFNQGRVAASFGNLVRKLQELTKFFTRFPKMWDRFKELIGVEGLTDLPGRVKDLAKEGYQALRKLVGKAFQHWPLKLYTLDKGKLKGINDLLNSALAKFPKLQSFLEQKVKPRVDAFDQWLRENLPVVSKVVIVAVYVWIWLNVVEFEWDMKSLVDALTGSIGLSDLLASLPGSALGFLMNALNLGTFTLLPVTLVVRLVYLVGRRYVVWTGEGIQVDWALLQKDFGSPASV